MKKILPVFSLAMLMLASCAKTSSIRPVGIDQRAQWVDSVYNGMTLPEKVGQLFMVSAYSNRSAAHSDSIQKLITSYHIGGLIFFQGGPMRQAVQTNAYQSASKVPLFIGVDGEWGLNMRLDSTAKYPYNMTLGAITDNKIIENIGEQIGNDSKRMGIHINFAPVVDINTNSNNPVIGVRSYGEDKVNVAEKAWAFTKGMENTGVLGSAKHFPGHGDTDTDSHKTLPTVSFSEKRIDSVELYPYKELFKRGVGGVMVAHLNVPNLESQAGLPSSLSYKIVTELLKEKLGYKGLIFTDALNMKGAADYGQPGDIDLAAFKAGNDVLLFSEDPAKAITKIVDAYNEKTITEARLAYSVKKILTAKFDTGLDAFQPIATKNLISDLNTERNGLLYNIAIKNAITLVKNDAHMLPLEKNSGKKIAYIKLGDGPAASFIEALKMSASITEITDIATKDIMDQLKNYDHIIIGYHRKNSRLTYAISKDDQQLIEGIAKQHQTVLAIFASQYSLKETRLNDVKSVLVAYENVAIANQVAAEIIFGESKAKGKLPASISKEFPVHTGVVIP